MGLTATPGLLMSTPDGSCCAGGSDGVAAGVSPTGSDGAGAGVGFSSTGSLAFGDGAAALSGSVDLPPPQAVSAAAKNRDVNVNAWRDLVGFTLVFMLGTSCDRS